MAQSQLEHIESKIAFLEHANAELSDEVLHLKRLLEEMRAAIAALAARLEAAKSDGAPWATEDERPPHY